MTASAAEGPPQAKRRKRTCGSQHEGLIEGLPDHVAELCLSLVRRPLLLSSVCCSWRRLVYSSDISSFLSLYVLFVDADPVHANPSFRFMCFDPVSSSWEPVPPPPPKPPLYHLVYRHPSFVSRKLPVQSISAAGKLVLLSGTTRDLLPALLCPLVFDPATRSWSSGPALEVPRRWCVAGTYDGAVYVASGIGSRFSADVAKSVEKWDLNGRKKWERMRDLKDGRFSREAIDAVGWKGRLLMVNVKGDAVKDGVAYNFSDETWRDMPEGMLAGWKGPVAAMVEDTLYAVDETKGSLRRYNEERDEWGDVVVECDERLKGAQHIAAAREKICIVADGGGVGAPRIVVVDVAEVPAKIWTVEAPPGLEPVAVHVLPKMSRPEFC